MRYLLVLVPAVTLANGVTNPPPNRTEPVTQTVTAPATATASPTVTASPTATGGAGGAGGNATAGSATSSSGGNAQTTTFTQPRQAPGLGQGALFVSGCAAGANGGSSSSGGAGFLGFTWTTSECHGWTLVQTLAQLGDLRGACEVLHTQKSARRAVKRGAALTACEALAK